MRRLSSRLVLSVVVPAGALLDSVVLQLARVDPMSAAIFHLVVRLVGIICGWI